MGRRLHETVARQGWKRSVLVAGISLLTTLLVSLTALAQGSRASPASQEKVKSATQGGPSWAKLSKMQKTALLPLRAEWDSIDSTRKEKWITIADKFATMAPQEQQRVQERMAEWIQLTPQQRSMARQSYANSKQYAPDEKSAQWQRYQQLSDEQKQKLAAQAAAKRSVTRIRPSPAKNAQTTPPAAGSPKSMVPEPLKPDGSN
jgi:hypothetical protein